MEVHENIVKLIEVIDTNKQVNYFLYIHKIKNKKSRKIIFFVKEKFN